MDVGQMSRKTVVPRRQKQAASVIPGAAWKIDAPRSRGTITANLPVPPAH